MIGYRNTIRTLCLALLVVGTAPEAWAGTAPEAPAGTAPEAPAGAAPVAPVGIFLQYHVYGLGIHGMTFHIRYVRRADRYKARFNAATDGVVEKLYEYGYTIHVKGARQDADLLPERYTSTSREPDGGKTIDIAYGADGEVVVESDQKWTPKLRRRLARRGQGTVDPMSAFLIIVETLASSGSCDARIPVFDGKRRYDLVTFDAEPATAPTGEAGAIDCTVEFRQVAGFRERDDVTGRYPETISVRFARVAPGFPLMPVEFTGTTLLGLMSIELVQVRAIPAT